ILRPHDASSPSRCARKLSTAIECAEPGRLVRFQDRNLERGIAAVVERAGGEQVAHDLERVGYVQFLCEDARHASEMRAGAAEDDVRCGCHEGPSRVRSMRADYASGSAPVHRNRWSLSRA